MTSLKTTALLTFAFGALLLGGCGILKKKQIDPAPSATQVALVAPPAATPTGAAEPVAAVADDAVAAPEDFEDEAFEKVTDKTYKAELASLKKDIEAK